MPYSLNDDLTPLQFEELRSSGSINPAATFTDYLALRQERAERAADARRLGLTGDDPPELTDEVEMLLSQVWDSMPQDRANEEQPMHELARAA